MLNLKNLFTRALLALMLVTGAGAGIATATAGPIYRVTIDTASLEGEGLLDFAFLGLDSSAAATAMLSNFRGDFGADSLLEGEASGSVATGVLLGNSAGLNAFTQTVSFGGVFGFDLRFDAAGAFGDGSTLGVALYTPGFGEYLLTQGNLAQFDLMPGAPVLVSFDSSFVTVTEVPEPAALALMAFGLALMAWTARQRGMR